jgi:hypothetical protein
VCRPYSTGDFVVIGLGVHRAVRLGFSWYPGELRAMKNQSKKAVYWGKKTVILFILLIRLGGRDSWEI